jgi:calmodulin
MPDIEELREIFDHFDADDNGHIDRAEFGRLMDALGADAAESELDVGFDLIDSGDNGTIDFNEFREWWENR